MILKLLSLPLVLFCLVLPANAATIDLSPLATLAGDYLQSLVELLAAVIVGAVAWAAKRWFGLLIDSRQREGLHGAIERGIGGALETLFQKSAGKASIEIDHEVIAMVADYVVKMSPDAVKHFGLTPDKLADLIQAKFGQTLLLDVTNGSVSDLPQSSEQGG